MSRYSEWKDAEQTCPQCGKPLKYRIVMSYDEAFEDEEIQCTKCSYTWWIDGPDA